MSDRRLQWSPSEKELLLQLRLSYPESTISELKYLFNSNVHFERHRTDEAVKSQLSRLKWKGEESIENDNTAHSEVQRQERQSLSRELSTKDISSMSNSQASKFAFAAPELGIYVPLHPLHAGDPFFMNYAKYLADMPANMPEPSGTNFRS